MGLENKGEIAAIISNPAARKSEKITQLLSLGEVKIANEYGRLRAVHKANKRAKAKLVETTLHNRNTEDETAKQHAISNDIAFKTLAQVVNENAKKRGFQQGENDLNRAAQLLQHH
jgi:hypothetical protein